ncbi:MAG: hypothetical protein DRO96_00570 [Candidatus Aenigmatarchaeota archaeon]|nr:MAG: hypothetical protein DRO96_00570 [Candidatus Aenigmarchaeota archaeon]
MLARNLLEADMSQTKVAEVLGITQGAVSQYSRSLRGAQSPLVKNKIVKGMVDKLTADILRGATQDKIMAKFCEICKEVRKRGLLCKRHKEVYPSLKECNICF